MSNPRALGRRAALVGASLAVLGSGLLSAVPAHAGLFGPKASRENFPAREVERPLDLPRGWSEFTFSHAIKFSSGSWSSDGEVVPFESAQWTYHRSQVSWRYGLSRRSDIQWDVPFLVGMLRNEELGTNLTSGALGDIRFWYRYRLYEEEAPMTAVVIESFIEGPTGRETPGTQRGGPAQMSNIITTSSSWDVYGGLAARRQVGPLRFTLRAGYMRRFSALSQFVVEVEEDQFTGRFKPGDRLQASVEFLGQVGPVALAAQPRFAYRGVTKAGVTADNWINPGKNLVAFDGSDGAELDLDLQLTVNATRGFDVHLQGSLPLMGEDLMFFPLEDVHPTYGPTFGAAVEARF